MLVERFLKHAAGMALLMGGWACSAQQAAIPARQIKQDVPLPAMLTAANSDLSIVPFSELASGTSTSLVPSVPASSAAGFVRVPPARGPRTLDAKYFLLNGLHLGMSGLDLAMTQHCIADHQCREGNPLMPSSLAGQLSVDFALVGYSSVSSYWLKKHHSRLWWISPAAGSAAHVAGAVTGFVH